jgi:hypothetical protein
MANYVYLDAHGTKCGPISKEQLQVLASQGFVTPTTLLEVEHGPKGVAGQIFWLEFNAVPASPSTSAHMFGRVLASGWGNRSSVFVSASFPSLIIACLFGVFMCFILPGMAREKHAKSLSSYKVNLSNAPSFITGTDEVEYRISWVSGLCGMLTFIGFFYAARRANGICKTKITVYENGIDGIGCGQYYDIDFGLPSFQLTFDKVTSVDITKSTITIYASGAQYKCYVQNPSEIQGIIVGQQQKRAGA